MLTLLGDPSWGRRTLTRRESLRAGLLGIGGLVVSDLLRLRAAASSEAKDTAVILLFVHGGPSHLETYDLKPDAPAEIRGPFRPIATNVPGIQLCEHLPLHARIADRFTLIRSCCHDQANHFEGHARFLSGHGQMKPGAQESYYPMVGAVVNGCMNTSTAACRRRSPSMVSASTGQITARASLRATGARSIASPSRTSPCAMPACA